jgi:hypothetical protein
MSGNATRSWLGRFASDSGSVSHSCCLVAAHQVIQGPVEEVSHQIVQFTSGKSTIRDNKPCGRLMLDDWWLSVIS